MLTTKKELIKIFSHVSQLTPTPTLKDFSVMVQDKNILTLTEEELTA